MNRVNLIFAVLAVALGAAFAFHSMNSNIAPKEKVAILDTVKTFEASKANISANAATVPIANENLEKGLNQINAEKKLAETENKALQKKLAELEIQLKSQIKKIKNQ